MIAMTSLTIIFSSITPIPEIIRTGMSAIPVTSCTIDPTSMGEKSKPVRFGIIRINALGL